MLTQWIMHSKLSTDTLRSLCVLAALRFTCLRDKPQRRKFAEITQSKLPKLQLLSENAKSMRWSRYFIPTLREDPADAEVISHKLLLRAGIVRQLSAGIYSYLPLGQRIARKVMNILREEMNAIGGQEFFLPALHAAEIWQESGRWFAIGDEMFRLKDRKGTDMCLGMTHEEVFTTIARNELRSYKQLPQVWYQIQSKFRDEARPKSGLIRVREFIMKDAYSFDVDRAGLDKSFNDQREAYKTIFTRCGIKFLIVEASSGAMGGSESNEFMARTPAGEDLIVSCENCGYAANLEKATSRLPEIADEVGPDAPEEFPTPGVRTIEDLITFPAVRKRHVRLSHLCSLPRSTANSARCWSYCAAIINCTKPNWLTVCARLPYVQRTRKRYAIFSARAPEVSEASAQKQKHARQKLICASLPIRR